MFGPVFASAGVSAYLAARERQMRAPGGIIPVPGTFSYTTTTTHRRCDYCRRVPDGREGTCKGCGAPAGSSR